MLTGVLRSKIDKVWEQLWAVGPEINDKGVLGVFNKEDTKGLIHAIEGVNKKAAVG